MNTTTSSVERQDTRWWLDRAGEAAQREGLVIVGFVVSMTGEGSVAAAEPFSSHTTLEPKDFVELVAEAARGMITQNEDN